MIPRTVRDVVVLTTVVSALPLLTVELWITVCVYLHPLLGMPVSFAFLLFSVFAIASVVEKRQLVPARKGSWEHRETLMEEYVRRRLQGF